MKARHLSSLVVLLAIVAGAVAADAPLPYYPQQAPEPGVGYQDCVTHSCKLVPETKQIKKTVYEVQEVPYCLKKLPPLLSLFHHHGCDDCDMCAECKPPRYRKVLVKKEIVCGEICTSKCVVEEHVERMPCQPSCK
jgi:hypothetical protein